MLLHDAGLLPSILDVISSLGPTDGVAITSYINIDRLAFIDSLGIEKVIIELHSDITCHISCIHCISIV